MNLTEQTINGTNIISVPDALNAALLRFKATTNENTIAPESNEFIIYVDKVSSENPSAERKSYIFNLTSPLKQVNDYSDEIVEELIITNNDIFMASCVNRKVGTNEEGNYVLDTPTLENLDTIPITLFEGTNYIYTNYADIDLEIIYPKNNDANKAFLSNAIYASNKKDKVLTLEDIYFKDSFTEVDEGINAEFNELRAKCLTSTNGTFRLDSMGNLTVNSIISMQDLGSDGDVDFDSIYPVGSIYMSVLNTNPSSYFGGSWEQITDTFLLAAGTTYTAGSTGGEATHTLTTTELPAHTHTASTNSTGAHTHNFQGYWRAGSGTSQPAVASYNKVSGDEVSDPTSILSAGAHKHTVTVNNTGSGTAHNNMPPYLAVYVWKRIA